MDIVDKIILENIVRLMGELNLNQKKLAEAANLDTVAINRILKGKKGTGEVSRKKLAKGLGCSVEDLIRRPEPRPIKPEFPSAREIAIEVVALSKPEPTGDRAELLRLIGTLDEDGVRSQLKTVRNYIAAKKPKRDDSSESRG